MVWWMGEAVEVDQVEKDVEDERRLGCGQRV